MTGPQHSVNFLCNALLFLLLFLCIAFVSMRLKLGKTFIQHGGDSLTAMQFTATVKELFGVNLHVDMLLSSNLSLDQLRDLISNNTSVGSTTGKDNTLDLMKTDMKLELPHFDNPKSVATNSIFLTGLCVIVCLFMCRYILLLSVEKVFAVLV